MKKSNEKIPVLVILGPTATGKSDLAVNLAKVFSGEVISADSRQVYRGMNLGTGKITRKEMRGVAHHLLDVADPKRASYNVAKFQRAAQKRIKEIYGRGKLPVVAGGTGFWIDALLSGQRFPDAPADKKLRKKLSSQPAEELFARLQKLDPLRSKNIDPKNKVRLIRAIEIALHAQKHGKNIKSEPTNQKTQTYSPIFIGLKLPIGKLRIRIQSRLEERLKKGMIAEVKKLREAGVSFNTLDKFGLEYRYISKYLKKELELDQMKKELNLAIGQYAKRQMTWFKRNKDISWLETGSKSLLARAEKIVKSSLK